MRCKFEKGQKGKGTLIIGREAQWEVCSVTSLIGLEMAYEVHPFSLLFSLTISRKNESKASWTFEFTTFHQRIPEKISGRTNRALSNARDDVCWKLSLEKSWAVVVCEPSIYSVMQLSSHRMLLTTSLVHNDTMHTRWCGLIEQGFSTAGLQLAASQVCSPTHAQAAAQISDRTALYQLLHLEWEMYLLWSLSWLKFLAL